jgi:DNA polymerase III epsilon subunit family exonuclease
MQDFLLNTPLKNLEFVSLDLETSGLNPEKDEIIEIGAIRFTKEKKISEFQQLVKSIRKIPRSVTKINGIKDKDLESEKNIIEVLPNFLSFIESSILVMQNSIFDLNFLIFASKMQRLEFPNLPVFCTVQMTRKLFPEFKKYGLVTLREKFQIPANRIRTKTKNSFHEALDDAYATMEVIKSCLNLSNGWEKTFPEVAFHSKNYLFSKDYDYFLI